ncbi:HAMP domain-containing sensor histidine kinase [Acrocarpospora macrocephala]|uniref:histidine kinase n=1 Tax=Acrocarpospora macrocephala TaxID=150177 RepID=A0A5M3WJF2_9ACTN|nr:ATP-binding protein [Acrocarpospora macrocephala]GES07311.1 two-component sensor histidine kinase [Acrocarpospora macrocephala]
MIRRRLVLSAAAPLAVALLALTVGFSVVLSLRLDHDADHALRARADAAAAVITVSQGRLQVIDTPYDEALDNGVWVFDARRAPVSSPASLGPLDQRARALAGVAQPTFRDAGSDVRLLAVPLREEEAPGGTLVVALSLAPFLQAERTALVAAAVFDVLLLGLGALFVRRAVTQALHPVSIMTDQAARWSEHDLDKRFGLGPPRDELSGLAGTLDNLLGRLSAALRHEQRVTAEIAHELRTPLSQVRLETEVALRRDRPAPELRAALTEVLGATDRMTNALDTLLGLAQHNIRPSDGTTPAGQVARDALASVGDRAGGLRMTLDLDGDDFLVGCDHDVVLRMVQPLLDNAVRFGRSAVTLRVRKEAGGVLFAVRDDGPGFGADELEEVLRPGVQGRASAGLAGVGLGLSLARRLAEAAGGSLTPRASPGGGLVELRLPVAG